MKVLRWLLPLVSLAIVLAVTLWDLGGARLGPGPLHPAHAALPELAGGSHCDACHRAGAGIDAGACTKCHAPIAAQLDVGRGLHGGLAAGLQRRCGTCHPEHHGALAPLIAGHSFALAGFPDANAYDHRHVDFGLAGAHSGLACTQCHVAADAVEPPAGGRYLGLTQACTACHEDVHRAAFGPGCEDCHGQERPFREAPGFRHATFVLEGAHRRVACADCHAAGTARDVAALRRQPLPARGCGDCHADPHGASAPRALRLERTADCA
ncbi:MAG: hypothetical protein KF830_18855, partial [Planctomycetes bacterium]|nr:hypothetical protein [Planctomycetota bacterium]